MILSACGGNEVENVEETETNEKEEAKAREKEKVKKAEEINNTVADFDNLSLTVKVHLATSIVDERANAQDL